MTLPPQVTYLGALILLGVMVVCLVLVIDDKLPLLLGGLIGFTALGAALR